MILFSIYDKLVPVSKDIVQTIDSKDLLKRDMLSRYRKMLADKDMVQLDKMSDMCVVFYGTIEKGVISLFSNDETNDVSLTSFLGLNEVKKDVKESN